jgi:hypothetical protein
MKLLFGLLLLTITNPFLVKDISNKVAMRSENQAIVQHALREHAFHFEFDHGGCHYTIDAFYNDETGLGHAYIARNCDGRLRVIRINISNVVPVNPISIDDIIEMVYDDDGSVAEEFSDAIFKGKIVDYMNAHMGDTNP